MTVSFDDPLRISEQVLYQEVHGETVLLDLAGERYYSLNDVGTRVWSLLGRGLSVTEIHACILAEYAVEPEVLTRDLATLLSDLTTTGLITVAVPAENAAD
ncbi:PqqD family protein [Candidatus Thiodictyon syntrophicum]|uniref:PqqD family protein n=1 Tax=Candidatus Thiodictyon syntrophicum TaxID=1166950 RepID=UPI0012FDAEB0|nr:PqqD family protein [Candidatus Thiodictyon syntrophicum]